DVRWILRHFDRSSIDLRRRQGKSESRHYFQTEIKDQLF
ncbi:hypothetical protein PRIPAC_84259, partial [Pristionchus pacificus]